MDPSETEKLARRFSDLRASGLVDVKFLFEDMSEATNESVAADVNAVFEAVDRGEHSEFSFGDSRQRRS